MTTINQQKITHFSLKNRVKINLKQELRRILLNLWEPLFYNRKRACDILRYIPTIKKECQESYKT